MTAPVVNQQSSTAEPLPGHECSILVGTCGYSYTGWAEAGFYPPDTKPGRMLSLYAQTFPVTELNYTWYQMPKAEGIERQLRQVPPDFIFTVKLNRELTHEPLSGRWQDLVAAFRHGIAPMIQSNQLAAVLVQLPAEFDRSVSNRRHLANLLDALEGLPLAVEFRQGSWNNEKVFTELSRRGVTLVAVDEPRLPGLFPPLDIVTNAELFYIRFHGRNEKGWRQGNKQLQFDYYYRESELQEWMKRRVHGMAAKAKQGIILFNNNARAQAPENAATLIRLLRDHGFTLGGA